jgi:hypothetical protein
MMIRIINPAEIRLLHPPMSHRKWYICHPYSKIKSATAQWYFVFELSDQRRGAMKASRTVGGHGNSSPYAVVFAQYVSGSKVAQSKAGAASGATSNGVALKDGSKSMMIA